MSEQTQDLAQAAIEQAVKYDLSGGATIEPITAEDAKDLPYLSKEMIDDGRARNVITVKITTSAITFIVDVLKSNPMQRIYRSKNRSQLIEISQRKNTGLSDELLEINYQENREIIRDHIVNPPISLEGPADGSLFIDEIPEDVQDLLIGAYEAVNNPRRVAKAVNRFPESDAE